MEVSMRYLKSILILSCLINLVVAQTIDNEIGDTGYFNVKTPTKTLFSIDGSNGHVSINTNYSGLDLNVGSSMSLYNPGGIAQLYINGNECRIIFRKNGSSKYMTYLKYNGLHFYNYYTRSNNMVFFPNGNTIFSPAVGNVGIGVVYPTEKLEVNGNVKASAFIGDGSQLTGIAGGGTADNLGDHTATQNIIMGDNWLGRTGLHSGIKFSNDNTVIIGHESSSINLAVMRQGTVRGGFNTNSGVFNLFGGTGGEHITIRSTGNIGIGTKSPKSKLEVMGRITGGFGAKTTGGVRNWDDISNAKSGSGYTLMRGTDSQNSPIPGGADYFHPFNFEYYKKDGSGNITQLAIPYVAHGGGGIYMRSRYNGTWYKWIRLIGEDWYGNVGLGTLTPTEKLEVAGNVKATAFIGDGSQLTGIAGGGTADNWGSQVVQTDATLSGDGTTASPLTVIGSTGSSASAYWATGTDDLPAHENSKHIGKYWGNVGIGAIWPKAKLQIWMDGFEWPEDGAIDISTNSNQPVEIKFSNYPEGEPGELPTWYIDGTPPPHLAQAQAMRDESLYKSWKLSMRDKRNSTDDHAFKFLYRDNKNASWSEMLAIRKDGILNVQKIRFLDGSIQTKAYTGQTGDGGTVDADNWGTQRVVTSSRLTGNGAETPLDIDQMGAGNGQVLKWNGSAWAPANDKTATGTNTGDDDWTISGSDMYSGVSGNVGIGTSNPSKKLDVNGDVRATKFYGDGSQLTGISGGGTADGDAWGVSDENQTIDIFRTGGVGINTASLGDYKLAVNGKIRAKEVKVEESNWSDFVFKDDYYLPTLKEVENYIDKNGHLPNIPSEAEVEENGINIGEMQAKLLQKIEELTLYVIQLEKEIDELKK